MTTPDAIHAADERLQTLLKAHVVGATVQDPASRPAGEDTAAAFTSAGALIPPYDPETLCLLVEHSNSLRQNVDAYATNIDGNGYRFDAVIDFDAEDARSKVADDITPERLAARDAPARYSLRIAHAQEPRLTSPIVRTIASWSAPFVPMKPFACATSPA